MQTATHIIGVLAALVSILVVARPGSRPSFVGGNAIFVDAPASQGQGCFGPNYLEDAGRYLVGKNGCIGCHSTDGSKSTGPTFRNLAWSLVQFTDGSTVIADDAYLRQSIINPQARTVHGFGPAMPSYLGRLSEREMTAMIEYLRSISVYDENSFPR